MRCSAGRCTARLLRTVLREMLLSASSLVHSSLMMRCTAYVGQGTQGGAVVMVVWLVMVHARVHAVVIHLEETHLLHDGFG